MSGFGVESAVIWRCNHSSSTAVARVVEVLFRQMWCLYDWYVQTYESNMKRSYRRRSVAAFDLKEKFDILGDFIHF